MPSLRTAQPCWSTNDIAVTPVRATPLLVETVASVRPLMPVVPLPRYVFPQERMVPSASSAKVAFAPLLTAVAVSGTPPAAVVPVSTTRGVNV